MRQRVCHCAASITMVGKKPVSLLVRSSIRSIPPSRDLTKLLITLLPRVGLYMCTDPLFALDQSPSVCGNSAELQLIAEFANSKHSLIVKLCFRFVLLFVTVHWSAVGGWDQKSALFYNLTFDPLWSYAPTKAKHNNLARVGHVAYAHRPLWSYVKHSLVWC